MLSDRNKRYLDENIYRITEDIFECIDERLHNNIMNDKNLKHLTIDEKLEAVNYVINEIKKAL